MAALAVLAFGVPLAVAVERLYANQAVLQLEREAARAVVEVPASFATTTDPVELPEPSARTTLGLYGIDGTLLLGSGPRRADGPTRAALDGSLRDGHAGGDVVVAAPVASEEEVVAVVRAATPMAEIRRRVALTWAAMAGFGLLIVVVAAAGARLLASRLATPVTSLAAATTRLGLGDFAVRADRSGIDELDRAAEALEATSLRLGRLMERERSFSADASHQLRTPLTGLRLQLETALLQDQGERDATLHRALSEIDRLEATIDGLLHLARDTGAPRTPLDVPALVASVERTWQGRLAQENRRLLLSDESEGRHPLVSAEAVAQVLDVLVGNALDHGSGTVQVVVRAAGDGLAIDITDEGAGIAATEAEIFERRSGPSSTRGIGLALARSLAEAEGAKLTLRRPSPPCFTLLLPPSG
ncbi:MAG: HAMP domain-containing sensor histidine kinase [Acidimicrobiales bacterium]